MEQIAMRLLLRLPLFVVIVIFTHLTVSFSQTVMHYTLAHHSRGGTLFHNHVGFHHRYYSKDHLVSSIYLGNEGNNTPYFFIPVLFVGILIYFMLPFDLFVVQVIACSASFYAHVVFDKEYHVEGSRLGRFAWFRRKRELHFVHHQHADSNFAVIDYFWDKMLGTYREPEPLPGMSSAFSSSSQRRPLQRTIMDSGESK